MRFTIASFVFTLVLGLAIAGPVTKITEKKSLVENTKLQKDEPKIEDIGDEKERSKKSTTTFCVEIRPGTNEAVQTPCACKDKGAQSSQAVPQSAPQTAPAAPQANPTPQAASALAPPSVNIIHAPPQQPQTLNIIQPAPTFHAVHYSQPQSNPSTVQNLHLIQPAAQLPEPVPQIHVYSHPSKPSMETHPSESSQIDLVNPYQPAVQPSEPSAPQPAASKPAAAKPAVQQENTEHSHKSEVHVSVLTEENKKEQDSKPQFEKIIETSQKPAETIKIVEVAPARQPCEEHFVVVPSNTVLPGPQMVPSMVPGTFFQAPFYQMPSPIYPQGGSILTQCTCKQKHPAYHHLRSMVMQPETKTEGRTSKIMPMTIVPYPVQSEKSALTVHCNPEESHISTPSQSHDSSSPMIVNMQTVRSKDGMQQGEENDMLQPNIMGERTVSHVTLDTHPGHYYGHVSHSPNIVYDMNPGIQASLHREPVVKPMYGNHHLYVDLGRNAEPTVTDLKQKETKVVSPTSQLPEVARVTRSEKDTTVKVEEKATEEKKIEEKTSSTKAA